MHASSHRHKKQIIRVRKSSKRDLCLHYCLLEQKYWSVFGSLEQKRAISKCDLLFHYCLLEQEILEVGCFVRTKTRDFEMRFIASLLFVRTRNIGCWLLR
jgi:hypothetical protein